MDAKTLVDYTKTLDCIHCGLCLNTCPTYKLTGVESSSPRGRIHLMRAVAEGQLEAEADFAEEMDFCLLCRNCESVCPSGVHFGAMMEHTRAGLELRKQRSIPARFARWIGFRVVLPHRFVLRTVATLGRFAQVSGALALIAKLGAARGRMLLDAPAVPPSEERERLPELTTARGARRGAVIVLEGCVMPELFGRVNRATVDVLAASGYDCRVVRSHVCCGSLHAHNGDLDGARALAKATIEEFEAAGADLPVVTNSAGCSAHMKEYAHLFEDDAEWKERARKFAPRVKDFSEFLATPEAFEGLTQAMARSGAQVDFGATAWDDPCHLCHAQQIRRQPRTLLAAVPGLVRVAMDDSEACCGSAGIYSLLRPDDAAAVLAPKLEALRACGAKTLVTANPGCHLQWATGVKRAQLDVNVVHIAEVLRDATRESGRVTSG
jgi:glycolate oxidase iron-sulfur subunit